MNQELYGVLKNFDHIHVYGEPGREQITLTKSWRYSCVLLPSGIVRIQVLLPGYSGLLLADHYQLLDEASSVGKHYFGPDWGISQELEGTSFTPFSISAGTPAHERHANINDFLKGKEGPYKLLCGDQLFDTLMFHPHTRAEAQTITLPGQTPIPFFKSKRVHIWSAQLWRS